MPSCKQCRQDFEVTKADLAFYDKVSPVIGGKKQSIPPPALCPACRSMRRLSFRNERTLYHRKCGLTGKQCISMYAPESPHAVYEQHAWWGDGWDALERGREFDFSRPFFDQFREVFLAAPRISLINKQHDNSEYCNFAFANKDSYLLFTTGECRNAYYSNRSEKLTDAGDCSSCIACERAYELVDSRDCYGCAWLQNCTNCSDCFAGYLLRGCRDCIGCYGLQNAEYHIGNRKFAPAEYERQKAALLADPRRLLENFQRHKAGLPRRFMDGIGNERCTGNAVNNSRDCHACYEVMHAEDCAFVSNATYMKDARDVDNDDHSELVYEAVGSESNYMHCFSDICWFDKHLLYCSLCFHSEHLFGCASLKRRKYCILNKQYTKGEYEGLVPKIIDHMRKTGEWGEFFPASLSPFGYNETVAQDYFPLTRAAAGATGWKWRDEDAREQYMGPPADVPALAVADGDTCAKIFRCETTGRPYKIIPQELRLYRGLGVPPPRKCFERRHLDRIALRNPRKLWSRACAKCSAAIETTYAPDRPEIVYCEDCYLKAVY